MDELRLKALPRTFRFCLGPLDEPVQAIGQGRYTKAFRSLPRPDVVYLVVSEGEYSKEILSRCQGPHVPYLQALGYYGDATVYQTDYYPRLMAKYGEAWAHYRTLAKALETAQRGIPFAQSDFGRRAMQGTIDLLTDETPDGHSLIPVIGALERICNWAESFDGDYTFEFAPRNLGVSSSGSLILVDPIFDLEELRRSRAAIMRKVRGWYGEGITDD